MAAGAADNRNGHHQKMAELSNFPEYLPAEVREGFLADSTARQSFVLQLLSSNLLAAVSCVVACMQQCSSTGGPAPPDSTEVLFGLKCLKILEELQTPTKLDFKLAVLRALWKLIIAGSQARPGRPLYGYSASAKILESFRAWLNYTDTEHIVPIWRPEAASQEEADQLDALRREVDVRVPLRLIFEEVRKSPRIDCSVGNSKRRNYVLQLVNVCASFTSFHGCISVSDAKELAAELAEKVDSLHVYSLVYAKLLVLTTPRVMTPQIILDGRLWSWWSRLPEGLIPKFDLMWFHCLARYAELRWANKVEDALRQTGSEGQSDECLGRLQEQLPFLMNKIARTLCVPFGSPAAKAVDGNKGERVPDLDRYPIPEEVDTVFMGNQTAWREVAIFLIYLLEPAPPQQPSPSNIWTLLTMLFRRMRPFLTPATSQGEWLWHCTTLMHNLTSQYFKRISQERLLETTAPKSNHLTAEADRAFLMLLLPLVRDLLTVRSAHEVVTSLDNLGRLTKISAMQPDLMALDPSSTIDPFRVDFHSMVMHATEVLNDPSMSGRHATLLRVFVSIMPALTCQMPAVIGELLPLTLLGIDPTDVSKTMSALRLLTSVFSQMLCLDLNDWELGDRIRDGDFSHVQWPLPPDASMKCGDPDYSATGIVSSMLPSFAVEFVQRACDYVTRIPKPRGAKQSKISIEGTCTGLLHGALCLVATQTDKETYKQMVEEVSEFLGTNLLPDQVKPAAQVIFAIARACPEVFLSMLLPKFFKKLLPHQSPAALHEVGVSESEAKWFLSLLSASVRSGGSWLLAYRQQLEAVIRSALLDEREAVTKLGMKLLRRVLYAITAIYVQADYRLCDDSVWQGLMGCRRGSTVPGGAGLSSLLWSGVKGPWWLAGGASGASASVSWHVPSEEEVAWARELVFGALDQAGKLLSSIVEVPSLKGGSFPEGTSWLDGFATSLPPKKKFAYGIILATRLINQVLRGTSDLWPDERSTAELEARQLPKNLKVAGNTAETMYAWLFPLVSSAFNELAVQEQYGVAQAGKLDQIDVSRVMRKLLKCIAELSGAWRDVHPSSLRLFPSLRQVDKEAQALAWHSTAMDRLHPHSRWRDLPRVWWVERVAETMEGRVHERRSALRYSGVRKKLVEAVAKQIFTSGFEPVRARALDIVTMAIQHHQGGRWPLVRDVLLPALAKETQAAAQCSSLTGDAADKEQQRLNDSLCGLASALGGRINGLIGAVWRRGSGLSDPGIDDAATIGLSLCEAIFAATRVSSSQAVLSSAGDSKDQKCEVKPNTVSRLISAMKHWLDCREGQCWAETRQRSNAPLLQDEIVDEVEAPTAPQNARGLSALRIVSKALQICERGDCHWRAQIMASTMSLALLNSLGALGLPPGLNVEETAEAKMVWLQWGRWLVKCMDPKGQPGMHALAVHSLQLMLKRSPLSQSEFAQLGIQDAGFFQNLLKVLPPLNHEDLMVTAEDQVGQKSEPTRGPVNVMVSHGFFEVWPRIWLRRSSNSFSLQNALFWQSYTKILMTELSGADLVGLFLKGAEELASQPVAEAEYHAAFAEFSAGVLRAVRKPGALQLRKSLWSQLRPLFLSALQQASEERLGTWCDAARFIATGYCRPELCRMFAEPAQEKPEHLSASLQYLTPLFNFVVAGDGELEFDALSCTLPPIRFEYDEKLSEDKGSSFDSFKRLRLLMSLLIEPSATQILSESFCKKLVETLEQGLGHPYKQLREEVARGLFFIVQAASHQDLMAEAGAGLKSVSLQLETWFCAEAVRLTPLLQADNAAHRNEGDEATRPKHVVESSGLVYVLLHASLARFTSARLRESASELLSFLVAAAAHGDLELRAIAPHALSLCCAAHPLTPGPEHQKLWQQLPMVKALKSLVSSSAPDKELEKALAAGLKPVIMANFFVLMNGGPEALSLYAELRSAAEHSLGKTKPEIRAAARGAVASFLTVEAEPEIRTRLKALKAKAGVPGKSDAKAENGDFCSIVSTMACTLLAAADLGVPKWSGLAIQTVAPYGKPGIQEAARKEVQAAIQAFLKLQQSSQQTWKECQDKLTSNQLDLLNDNKGKLSYFS